jgi:hypothetical protein
MMKYRGIEYAVVQEIGRQVWKWSASVAEVVIRGQAATSPRRWPKPSVRLTERWLLKNCGLCRPETAIEINANARAN